MTTQFMETLERLALAFTAQDIMVSKRGLLCAKDEVSARKLLEDNPDFDVIPIEQNGILSSYVERGSGQPKPICPPSVVSGNAPILDVVDILKEQQFCFVLVKNSIEGYVHFSDLNRDIVKLPFFFILHALEHRLVTEIGSLIDESSLEVVLDPERTKAVKDRIGYQRENRANLGLVNLLHFREIVQFACHFGKLKLKKEEISVISHARNLVCHAGRPLVERHDDVRRLVEAKRICVSCFENAPARNQVYHG